MCSSAACVCVCARRLTLPERHAGVPIPSVNAQGSRRDFIGVMCIIRREGRGLCFDRVTAAKGAEFVVV